MPAFAAQPRRRRRRVRLVAITPTSKSARGSRDYSTEWHLGLRLAHATRRFFPEWYAEHIAAMPTTPLNLMRISGAFISLVHTRRFPLDDQFDTPICVSDTPEDWLTTDTTYGWNPLDSLSESGHYLYQPWPEFYGLGVQSALGYTEDLEEYYTPLTMAIWRLFSGTTRSLGYGLEDIMDRQVNISESERAAIMGIEPLPSLDVDALLERLAFDHWTLKTPPKMLIDYAFGQTGNQLADYTSMEVGEIFFDNELSWGDLDAITEQAQEAEIIMRDYSTWESQIEAGGARAIADLAQAVHAQALGLAPPSPYLIDILAAQEHPDDSILEANASAQIAALAE